MFKHSKGMKTNTIASKAFINVECDTSLLLSTNLEYGTGVVQEYFFHIGSMVISQDFIFKSMLRWDLAL